MIVPEDAPPYRQPLADGLVMCTVASDDVERVAELNGVIHGAGIVPIY